MNLFLFSEKCVASEFSLNFRDLQFISEKFIAMSLIGFFDLLLHPLSLYKSPFLLPATSVALIPLTLLSYTRGNSSSVSSSEEDEDSFSKGGSFCLS